MSGLSLRFINYIEHDKKKPSYRSLTKIADATNRNMTIKYTTEGKITNVYFSFSGNGCAQDFKTRVGKLRDRLFQDCLVKLCRFDKNKADDLTQETICRAYEYSYRYNERHQLYTWLFGIAKNINGDNKKKDKHLTFIESYFECGTEPDEVREQIYLSQYINGLSENSKRLYLLKLSNATYEEMGRSLGIKATSAKSKFWKLKKQILDHITHATANQ